MTKRFSLPRLFGVLAAFSCTCATLAVAAQVAPAHEKSPPDTSGIIILAVDAPEKGDLPPVVFDHNLHTKGPLPGETCETCHEGLAFRAAMDKTGKDLENAYHDACLSCHTEVKAQGKASPPQKAECRSCHNASALQAANARQQKTDGGFDASLHTRHINSDKITVPDSAENCAACHHPVERLSSPALTADSCRSCHGASPGVKGAEKAPPFATAAHTACINCHATLTSPETNLPLTCDSCHNAAKRAEYATLYPVPRLKAGQPDTVLMGGNAAPASGDSSLAPKALPDDSLAKAARPRESMAPVMFDHKLHEAADDSCIRCHHNTLQKCSDCHTPSGSAKGGGVTQSAAMHKPDSPLSCVGCHETQKTARPECAGCHAIMPQANASRPDCESCHRPPQADFAPPAGSSRNGDQPGERTVHDTVSLPIADPPAGSRERAALANAPETISIGALADEFEPSVFPHQRIVESLIAGLEKSAPGMMRFHSEPYSLCASCHHNSPPSASPPPCATCHSKTGTNAAASSPAAPPSLQAAYHQQCITCHTAMDIKPAATDCAGCHAKRATPGKGGR